ncbi:large conductance mechanosensitive channel protein MscL [Aquisalibacillus elongatus]|uniref:Large-conductance mechanosensitive channel n=1 Tax=Aquisalibacillus elongatus TaxID=485577 RepID=A0A3N5AZB3_9BACI|nr:large conductance mechanosensitive channel protein MscL [Aquisalibacillus elongatus]RPF50616.1 large conductance mechanosensitive channel [Aquisalibacillus elongatus]
MWKEFKQFALRGNVIELAVAVIIGTAFSKIVDSLVNDLLVPVLGILAGGTSLKFLVLNIDGVVIRYGAFIQTTIDFMVIAFSIFIFIKLFNYLRGKESVSLKEAPHPNQEVLTEIRDLLKDQQKPKKKSPSKKMKINIK